MHRVPHVSFLKTTITPASMKLLTLALLLTITTFAARAQTNFARLAQDGAWTWYNDPRALFHNGTLYFGYVRHSDGKTVLSAFNPKTGTSAELWTSTRSERDDHNVPGLLVLSDNRLLAIYARHITDQFFAYRISTSTNPVSASDWGEEKTIPSTGAGMTYANPYRLAVEPGLIFDFARNLNYNPTLFISTNNGDSWSAAQRFIHTGGGNVRPYVKYSSNYSNRIDFLYTDGHPRDVTNSLYHLSYQDRTFHRTDGTRIRAFDDLPILHDNGERGSVIYRYNTEEQADPNEWIPTGRAWNWDIANQPNGAPVCVFIVQRDNVTGSGWEQDRIYYYYARWTGTNWQKRFIAHAGRPLYRSEDDYAGGICIDPMNPSVIYLSSNAADPFALGNTKDVPLRRDARYEIWKGVTRDGGLTFDWDQVTTDSVADNLRPYVPRRNGGEPCVLWFQGNYRTYTDYTCSIVGLFTTKINR